MRGQTLFQGYWTNGILSLPVDSDGWFATGDLVQIHPNGTWSFSDGKILCLFAEGKLLSRRNRTRTAKIARSDGCLCRWHNRFRMGLKPVAFVQHVEKNYPLETLKEQLRETLPTIKIPARFFPLDPTQFHGSNLHGLYLNNLLK